MTDRAVVERGDFWLFVRDHKRGRNKMCRHEVRIVPLLCDQVLMRTVRKKCSELTRMRTYGKSQDRPGTHCRNDVTGPAKGTARAVYVFGMTTEAGCVRRKRSDI